MDDRRPRGGHGSTSSGTDGAGWYEIRVRGDLHPRWTAWFGGLTVRSGGDGTTVIAGPVADQAALHGTLQRVRDLGIALESVTRIAGPTDASTRRPVKEHHR